MLVDMAFATGLTTGLPGLLRHAGLPGCDVEQATDFHLNSVFEASLLVGIFDEPYRVVGVVFVTSLIATVQRLRTAEPSALRMSWTWHIPGLAAPLIYMMHVRLIRTWVNAEHYFVYRCQAGIDWEEKTSVMIALFLTRVTLLQVEVLYSALSSKRQQKDTIDMLRGAVETLRQHFNYVVFCQAFAATLFTSCFFIRHDGLAPIFVNYVEPATCLLPDAGEKGWGLGFVQRLLRKYRAQVSVVYMFAFANKVHCYSPMHTTHYSPLRSGSTISEENTLHAWSTIALSFVASPATSTATNPSPRLCASIFAYS